jgi:hypothetical protein
MDPTDPQSFNHRTEQLSTGRTYHFVDEKPENYPDNPSPFAAAAVPTILCIHGFPDIWWAFLFSHKQKGNKISMDLAVSDWHDMSGMAGGIKSALGCVLGIALSCRICLDTVGRTSR